MSSASEKWLLPDSLSNPERSLYRGANTAPIADLRYGAQDGFMINPSEFEASASYIQGNLICLLLEAPGGFQKMDYADLRVATLKSLVEEQARSITGLNHTSTVSMNETPLGGSGEVHQDISNVVCARSAPTFMWSEKPGRAIGLFMDNWIFDLGMDYSTKIPRIVNYNRDISARDFVPSFRTMTCLFFEPDPSLRRVVSAWLCGNMFPITGGDHTGTRDLTAENANRDISIEFSATTQVGAAVSLYAQEKLDEMNLANANPHHLPSFRSDVSKDVDAADTGFIKGMNRVNR